MPHILNSAREMISAPPLRVFVSMPRFSLKSIALFVVAGCISWQGAGTGISTALAGCGDYVHLAGMESTGKPTGIADSVLGLESIAPNAEFPHRPCQGPR